VAPVVYAPADDRLRNNRDGQGDGVQIPFKTS